MGPGPEEVNEVDQLRRAIDESRENLGAAVGALAYKADVKNRGKEALEDKKEALMEKAEDLKSKLPGSGDSEGGGIGEKVKSKLPSAGDATPSKQELKAKAQDAAETAGNKPAAIAAGAAAAGLVAGLAIPETELERQKLAPKVQQARADAKTRAKEKVEQAKSALNVAEQAAKGLAQSATGAVREQGQQQEGKLGDVLEKTADKADEKVDTQGQ